MDINQILKEANNILIITPNEPFLCLQMSSMLYAMLKDNYNLSPKIIIGNLYFKNECLFKQDYSLNKKIGNCSQTIKDNWSGHCWIELDDKIIDLSIFRTIYSQQFNKSCKNSMIDFFGTGRGYLIIDKRLNQTGLKYQSIEELNDEAVDGIIKGLKEYLTP